MVDFCRLGKIFVYRLLYCSGTKFHAIVNNNVLIG